VIIQNTENPWPTVIKPRLEMLGADCIKIYAINDSEKEDKSKVDEAIDFFQKYLRTGRSRQRK
jgi:hypothetical protein